MRTSKEKKGEVEYLEITEEMFKECEIPKPLFSITETFENGDEYYEDENYIGWNGICAKKVKK